MNKQNEDREPSFAEVLLYLFIASCNLAFVYFLIQMLWG